MSESEVANSVKREKLNECYDGTKLSNAKCYSWYLQLYTSTYNKAITILDENITESTVASEKSLKVSFPGAVWKPTDIDPCPYHTVKKTIEPH